MTGYSAGMLRERVKFTQPGIYIDGEYGREKRPGLQLVRWAAVDWVRGTKAMREGALDAYDTIMVRLRWDKDVTRECKIEFNDRIYAIQSFHEDKHAGTIQLTAIELSDTPEDYPSESSSSGGSGSESSSDFSS